MRAVLFLSLLSLYMYSFLLSCLCLCLCLSVSLSRCFFISLLISLCVCLHAELFLRKKEDDIRISIQELCQQVYNEDEVIGELQAMITDITRTRQPIPQVVELQRLSYLNRDALERGSGPLLFQRDGGVNRDLVERGGDGGVYRDAVQRGDGGVYRDTVQGGNDGGVYRDHMTEQRTRPHQPRGVAPRHDEVMYRGNLDAPAPHPLGPQERGVYHGRPLGNTLYNISDDHRGSSTLV